MSVSEVMLNSSEFRQRHESKQQQDDEHYVLWCPRQSKELSSLFSPMAYSQAAFILIFERIAHCLSSPCIIMHLFSAHHLQADLLLIIMLIVLFPNDQVHKCQSRSCSTNMQWGIFIFDNVICVWECIWPMTLQLETYLRLCGAADLTFWFTYCIFTCCCNNWILCLVKRQNIHFLQLNPRRPQISFRLKDKHRQGTISFSIG